MGKLIDLAERRRPAAPTLADPARLAEIPPEAISAVLGELEAARAALWARLMRESAARARSEPPAEADRLLTAKQAAEIASVSPKWLYRHAKSLPFARRLSLRTLRFSEQGLRRWLAARKV